MNQSKTKAKITFIAILAILFACVLLVVCVVEIKQYNNYKQQIFAQEQEIQRLQNLKDYYNSGNYDDNTSRDNGNANNGDLIFEEE